MNYRKIYESVKLDEELLQEFNFKKAAAVGLMGLGLASGAFAKSKPQQQKSNVISQKDFLNKCIEFIDEEGQESIYYTLEDMLDMLEADGIKVDGVIDMAGDKHALKGKPGLIKGNLSKKQIQKALQNGGTLDSFANGGFYASN
jgi:hypothetical protein